MSTQQFRSGTLVKITGITYTEDEFGTNDNMSDMVGRHFTVQKVRADYLIINNYSWHPNDIQLRDVIKQPKVNNPKEFYFNENLL